MQPEVQELVKTWEEIGHLEGIHSLLHWDQATQMPKGAIEARGKQGALVSTLIHERMTSSDLKKQLEQFVDIESGSLKRESLEPMQARMVQEMARDFKRANCFPAAFIEKQSTLQTASQAAWEKAYAKDDFALFAPHLERMIDLAKEKADYASGGHDCAYDALLDEFEPGFTTKQVDQLFDELKTATMSLLQKIDSSENKINDDFFHREYDEQSQWELLKEVVAGLGLSDQNSRVDKSVHPFCTHFHTTDVRITSRVSKNKLKESLSATIHEAGHAFYELGLNKDWFGTPLAKAIGAGVHESQSRFWEQVLGCTESFSKWLLPYIQNKFPTEFSQVNAHQLYQGFNTVRPSFIRVEADELTYNLHVIIRYEIEKGMLEGKIKANDVPEVWNSKYQEYLGITPPTNKVGCLQDVHWSWAAFGYFPTYTLGNLMSVVTFEACQKKFPQLDDMLAGGDFAPIRTWLKEVLHSKGRSMNANEYVKSLTGAEFGTEAFIKYTNQKYQDLYGF